MAKPVKVHFIGDTKDLQKAFGQVEGKASGMGSHIKKAAGVAAGGLAIVGVAAGKMAIESVKAFSDLSEASSKASTIFGKSFGEIERIAEGGAQAMGLSKAAVLDYAGSFGNLFSQLGVTSEKSVDMSKNILQLAADFGSFHNADITEVLNAQSAAFRGEYDALQRFLPLVNAATVEQKAMSMTGKESAATLTAQEKALAVYQLMLEGAGAAQGDFARTSDGLANQQRILKAEFDNVKTSIGGLLQNEFLPGLIEGFGKATGNGKSAAEQMADFRKKLDESGPAVRDFAKNVGEIASAVLDVIGAIKEAIGWLDKFIGKESAANKVIGWATGSTPARIAANAAGGGSKPMAKNYHGIPGRAAGGPVTSGQPYMVGERGPELFVPNGSGHIQPNRSGGQPVYLNVITMDQIETQMVNRLQRRGLRGA